MSERLYSTEEVCALLCVSPSTLRRWRVRLSMQNAPDPAHLARKMYTEEQLLHLAEAHHRIVLVASINQEKIEALGLRVRALELHCWGGIPGS